jgi:hypothetical protein
MRCDTGQHRFYCGVDRHARTLFTHVLDAQGKTVFEKDLPTDPAAFLAALAPFRPDLVVGAECVFAWYWLADRCEDEPIPFALGHALAMNHTRCGPTAECSLTVADAAGRESPRADEGLDPHATRLPAAATHRGLVRLGWTETDADAWTIPGRREVGELADRGCPTVTMRRRHQRRARNRCLYSCG